MPENLRNILQCERLTPDEISLRTRQIYDAALAESPCLKEGNFNLIHYDDVELLFRHYDRIFFDGHLHRLTKGRISFRVSSRMTKAGGKTTRHVRRIDHYEKFDIAISSHLLFQSFRNGGRPIKVTGIECRDRLEAMQRVFEHELVHLSEMLVWKESKCAMPRFQSIATRMFGHREHTHRLITSNERAWTEQKIRSGTRVAFEFEGRRHVGVVNRITKRATVLVEDPQGEPYSDGRRYRKWYVPLAHLTPVS